MPVTIDGSNTPTAGGVGYGDGTELAFTSAGSAGQVLQSNGAGAPTWAAVPTVNLATGVTGTLPVANGGTGATSLTANNVLLGNGTSAVQVVAPGTNGNVLTSNGTTWTSAAPAGAPALVYLSTTTTSSSSDLSISLSSYTSTYSAFRIVCTNINADSTGNITYPYLKINNSGSGYAAGIGGGRNTQGSGSFAFGSYDTGQIPLFYGSIDFISDGSGAAASFVAEFYNMNSSSRKFFTGYSAQSDFNGTLYAAGASFGGMWVNGSTPTSINIVASNNFAATVILYGIKTS